MSPRSPAVIVGDDDDPHVCAVVEQILAAKHPNPDVVNLDQIQTSSVALTESGAFIGRADPHPRVDLSRPRRGWLRRLHSPDWAFGLKAGDVASVEAAAWHTAFTGVLIEAAVEWLTHPTALRISESKINQWRTARALGVQFPQTLVTSDPIEVAERFQGDVVVKPLGAAQFRIDGVTHTNFAHRVSPRDPILSALRSAPFIVQECLEANRHLRIVTVGSEAWVSALIATEGMPTDWRAEPANHRGFRPVHTGMSQVVGESLRVARAFGLGYSSQDWIETGDGFFLIDVNPSGQWLFLDDVVSVGISAAIAQQLIAPLNEAAI